MGLDMYLTKRVYVGNKHRKPEEQVTITIPKSQGDALFPTPQIPTEKISEIIVDVAYWRKANQIHGWFVENVQRGNDDCGEYPVSLGKLQELVDLCSLVLTSSVLVEGKVRNGERLVNGKWESIIVEGKKIKDSTVAELMLPATKGFFFGGEEYNEYYYDDLRYTVEQLEPELSVWSSDDYYYSSSW
jgi:hypothetical protein